MDLAPHVRYRHVDFQAAADAAARHPDVLLRPYDAAELSYIAAAYAAAQHVHWPFLSRLRDELLVRIAGVTAGGGRQHGDRGSDGKADVRSGRRGGGGRDNQDEAGDAMEGWPGGKQGKRKGRCQEDEEDLEAEAPFPLSFRQTCIFLASMARLGWPEGQLMAVLGGRLAAGFRDGEVLPRNRWQGTWLSAGLWAYATLMRELQQQQQAPGPHQLLLQTQAPQQQQQQQPSGTPPASAAGPLTAVNANAATVNGALAAGAALFTEAAELVRVSPGWLHLMDGREALWALWAFRTAAHVLADGGGGLPGGSLEGGVRLGPRAGPAAQAAGAGVGAVAATDGGASAAAAAAAASAAALRLWYEADPLVELKLTERAASMVGPAESLCTPHCSLSRPHVRQPHGPALSVCICHALQSCSPLNASAAGCCRPYPHHKTVRQHTYGTWPYPTAPSRLAHRWPSSLRRSWRRLLLQPRRWGCGTRTSGGRCARPRWPGRRRSGRSRWRCWWPPWRSCRCGGKGWAQGALLWVPHRTVPGSSMLSFDV